MADTDGALVPCPIVVMAASGDRVLRGEIFAVPVGSVASPILVHRCPQQVVAAPCQVGGEPGVITAHLDAAARLVLERFELTEASARSAVTVTVDSPWSLDKRQRSRDLVDGVRPCPDVDGDGEADFVVVLDDRRAADVDRAMVLLCSSAELQPLAKLQVPRLEKLSWCIVGGGDEPVELLMIEEMLPGTGIDAQLRRYVLR